MSDQYDPRIHGQQAHTGQVQDAAYTDAPMMGDLPPEPNYGTPQQQHRISESPEAQAQLQAAMADQRQQQAQQSGQRPVQETPAQRIGKRSDALRDALALHQAKDYVTLPVLTSRSTVGPVRLRARRLVLQELAASNMLPQRADELVSKLMDRALEATESGRKQWGIDEAPLTQDDVNDVVDELYGGWNREAVAAFYEFQCIVCCMAVIDEKTRLVMTWEDVETDPVRNVLVWELPEEDREAIYSWAMEQEAKAEATVMPFR